MRRSVYSLAALAVLSSAAGCAMPTGIKVGGSQAASVQVAAASVLTGSVMAPAGVISAGGGNVISAGGGNYQTLALTESALANAEVFLADAAGEPLPGVKPVKTDAKGQFKFENVPDGYTFVVAARCKTKEGKDATLQTLTRPTKLGATANISAATTLVTAAVVDGQSDLGEFNAAKFKTAAEATAKNLKPEAMPDFSDRAKILGAVAELQQTVAELKAAIEEIRADLKEIKASLEELKQQLASGQQPGGMQPPPAGMQPPPGGQVPPPPGGVMPPPPDGQMQPPGGQVQPAEPVEHVFVLKDVPAEHFPLKVRLMVPNSTQAVAEFAFRSPDDRPVGKLPEGLAHDVQYSSPLARAVAPGFVVPQGAPREVVMPYPRFEGTAEPGATGSTTTTTDPAKTTTQETSQPVTRRLSLKLDGKNAFLQRAPMPLKVEFYLPNTRTPVTFSFSRPDEVLAQEVPCGVRGKLVYTPNGGNAQSVPDFGFPPDGPTELLLPGPQL